MREILFRGKCVDNDGEWAVGAGVLQAKNHAYIFICAGAPCNRDYYATLEVIPETVGQYTGLTDKNGNKIFEGDILEFTDSDGVKSPYIIEWEEVDCCYVIERPDGEWFEILEPEQYRHNCVCDDYISDDCVNWRCDRFEIISNIHDNPDFFDGTSYDEI